MAAYLYLSRQSDEKSSHTKRVEPGMVVDFGPQGNPIGIEITAPAQVTLTAINSVLEGLGVSPLTTADIAPLLAA
jgi:uncharacterized protein YuzE